MQFYEISLCVLMIFNLYTFYKKHDKGKIGDEIRENNYYRIFFLPADNTFFILV